MTSQDPFDRVLALLHAAALDDTRWPEAASLIGEIIRAQGHGLAFLGGHSPEDIQIFWRRISFCGERREDWERNYFEQYMPRDERVPRILGLRHGDLAHTRDVYTDQEKEKSPVYNEALVEMRGQNGLQIRLDAPEGKHVVWAICDSSEPGGWGFDQITTIERLQPHVRQCILVRHALADAQALGESIAELLDSTRFGVVQLDPHGRIVRTNDQALEILRQGDGLGDRGGFLHAPAPDANAELYRLLGRACPRFGLRGAAGSMQIRRASHSTPLILHINPVGEEQTNVGAHRIAALALILDPASRMRIDPRVVAGVLRLTPEESRLAVDLSGGHALSAIAESTGRTEETVRSRLKVILRKQGISRRVELIRRVLSLRNLPDSRN